MKHEQNELIGRLINNRFNLETFKEFCARVLNVSVTVNIDNKVEWTEFNDYIESYKNLASYIDLNNKRISIIVVKVKDYHDEDNEERQIKINRAKTKQRNFIARILEEQNKDAALVVFYNSSEMSWKISFVKLDFSFKQNGIEKRVTPSKRASYEVGEGQGNRTAIDQFSSLINTKSEVSLSQLENLFLLEKVTDDFFEAYKKKYLDLKEKLEENEVFRTEAIKHSENIEEFSEEFSKKLMGQLAFLYFLQKRGWLGVKIVPEKLNEQQFMDIYSRASSTGKESLDKAYLKKSSTEFKLRDYDDTGSSFDYNSLADCFKNDERFDKRWGTGEKQFIRNLFNNHKSKNIERISYGKEPKNFFNDYLEPMFYEALNYNRGDNQYFPLFYCKIPFLNGGLFEALDNYDWKNTNFNIPDEVFSNSKEKFDGDGILDVFDRFNFTINENDSSETEVAVDPEMLGKVFENLLDVKDRKSKGAFYTPREIVHYMCKESLINYLSSEIPNLEKNDFDKLSQMGEFTKDYDLGIFLKGKRERNIIISNLLLSEKIYNNIYKLDEALSNVRVADPAIGSGAFPLGMLNEIVKVRNILTEYMLMNEYILLLKENREEEFYGIEYTLRKQRSLYKLKLETIENCLYGVDIVPSAVDIAKLRLWLSIVVDCPDSDIKPLPNLDFKLMIGDSLLDEFKGESLFDEKLLNNKKLGKKHMNYSTEFNFDVLAGVQRKIDGSIDTIELLERINYLRPIFFCEKNIDNKNKLKELINQYEWILIQESLRNSGNLENIKELEMLQKFRRKPYFLWKLEFAQVFQEKKGFDIIIGNPPYLRIQGIQEEYANRYKEKFKSATGSYDLYVLFTENGLNLLKPKGTLNFIMPHKWTNASFGKGLREVIGLNKYLYKFISFGAYQVFNASTYTSLMWLEKDVNKSMDYYEVSSDILNNRELELLLNSLKEEDYVKIENSELSPKIVKKGKQVKYEDVIWNLMPSKNMNIINRIKKQSRTVKDIFSQVFTGLQTSKDSVYFLHDCKEIDEFLIEGLSQEINRRIVIEKTLVKPLLKGDMVHRYDKIWTDKVVILPYDISGDKAILFSEEYLKNEFPLGYSYLKECEFVLRDREKGKLLNDDYWFKYIYPKNLVSFKNEKLVAPDISMNCNFSYDKKGEFYQTTTIYGYIKNEHIKESYKFLLAIMNSKVLWYFLINTGAVMANGFFRFKSSYINPFPIPEIDDLRKMKPFENLVDYVMFVKENKEKFNDMNVSSSFIISQFEEVINALVYELYFKKEMKENKISFIDYALSSFASIENETLERQQAIVKKEFINLSDKDNQIRNNIILMKVRLEDLISPIDGSI